MRVFLLLASLVVVEAALGQGSRVRIAVAGHNGPVSVDSMAASFEVPASRGAAFHAAAQAMLEFRIKPSTRDSIRGTVGIVNLAHRVTFARSPIRRFLDCGIGIMGANADNWRVYITAFAFVDGRDSTRSALRVAIVGGARDVAGSSTDAVACASTGAFESMFAERVKLRLATGAP